MPITVRPARRADIATIAAFNLRMAWETEAKRLNLSTLERGVSGVFDDPRRGGYFVAEIDGLVVGCLLVTHEWSDWRDGDMWWIQSVYVVDSHRRRGVFRALFAATRLAAEAAGAVALRLYVERDNVLAQQTYAALGMSAAGYEVFHLDLAPRGT